MLHILLLTCYLVISAVIGEGKVKIPEETLPVDNASFLNKDEFNEDAHYGMKKNNQHNSMQPDRRYYSQKYNHEDHTEREEEDYRGPAILRSINSKNIHGSDPDIVRQNKIIEDVYSPDYHQPIWVLDYRYMKTGGRDYTRGPGGQILILPKNVHTDVRKEFPDYDSLLEHLRLKNMAKKDELQRH